jgi:hypothetical protein
MSNDLVEFLRARLDEDEQAAQAVERFHPGPWRLDPEVQTTMETGRWVADGNDEGVLVANGDGPAALFAHYHPARVLADVAAKRALLDHVMRWRHDDPDEGGYYACPAVRSESLGDLPFGEDECTCGQRLRRQVILAPFAAAYAGHPEYRQEWSPGV